ncbi:alpha/beta-hydrolase [Suhomyces tanzawaensis NRRL Y-17324]|uniref:Alpha/beta-hydrolase n=1 Tax=Suhomyces tanzawaensis NRRL Y-17324 TaxID=984487 RepID=A0A1E4SRD9_9ASCO|nr:alpha/beta-hydrolase [Suhomyces tanzawaensis NRRL Y-17324]ODV82007.1 alpha/beta-hydrolase [Suhomyces tanzawaensis NRRL Y-17324]
MFEELTPKEKLVRHGPFKAFVLRVISFFGATWFVGTMSIGALFYHLYQLITGQEKGASGSPAANGYLPRKAFPNLEKMKPTLDLRYYVLELGLDLEEYAITTEDGFVLPLHRVIDPKETAEQRNARKPVLLQHGLLSCSGGYITSGTNSMAYYLTEMGYDVWLGNNRSHFEPKHSYFEGNLFHNELYWEWDIRNLAYYDLPCIIDNVLAHKPSHEQLVLVGHSQGCTQTFLMLKNGNLKRYHDKIEHFFPLAPAVFPGVLFLERWFLRFLHNRGRLAFKAIFGLCAFLKVLGTARNNMGTTSIFHFNAYILYKFLFGWSAKKWSQSDKVRHYNALFNCTFVSAKLMNWWLSYYVEEGFSNQVLPHSDYKSGKNYAVLPPNTPIITARGTDDSKSFFPFTKSWFSDADVNVPIHIFAGDGDHLVDGKRLITHMRNYEPNYQEGKNLQVTELDDYDHCDFIWAEDLNGRISVVIHQELEKLQAQLTGTGQPVTVLEKVHEDEKVLELPFEQPAVAVAVN